MNLSFGSKKEKIPEVGDLRPPLFNVEKKWHLSLLVFLLIFLATLLIDLKLFFVESSESYRGESQTLNADDLINSTRLKKAIQDREIFVNSTTTVPKDPSI